MKRFLLISLLLALPLNGNAQWISGSRLDDGMYAFRNSVAPDFHHSADDYLQYSPGAAMLLVKACGVEGRSTWGSLAVSSAFSVVIEALLVNGMKYTVGRIRPNESERNSFPSGHTATAFMSATLLQKEFGWKYPWVGFGGYAIASGVGLSRIFNNMHWQGDVIGGAVAGIVSSELGYWLSSLIFKEKGYKPGFVDGPGWREMAAEGEGAAYDRLPYELGGYFSTAAWFLPFRKGVFAGTSEGKVSSGEEGKNTAFSSVGLTASIPFAKNMGACARAGIAGREYMPQDGSQSRSYSASYEAMAGIYADWNFFSLAFVRPHAYFGAGFGKGFVDGEAADAVSCRPQCAAGVDLGLQITDNYALKFIADYTCSFRNWSAVMLGGSAAFCF